MSVLDDWTQAVRRTLELDADSSADTDRTLVLDLARDAAHGVARPAAPLTTYLLGIAVGRGADPRQAAERVTELAKSWGRDDGGD